MADIKWPRSFRNASERPADRVEEAQMSGKVLKFTTPPRLRPDVPPFDPTNPAHLAVVWSDMRDSVTPAPGDPYTAKTNSDVIVSQSFDAGATWSAPTPLGLPGDQFMPWGVYDTSGHLRIGMFDRSVDPANL